MVSRNFLNVDPASRKRPPAIDRIVRRAHIAAGPKQSYLAFVRLRHIAVDYLVSSAFIVLDKLPLTASDKRLRFVA